MEPKKGIYKIEPSVFLKHSQSGYPVILRGRFTYEVYFDQKAMQHVPPGMYDIRFEILDEGKKEASVFEYQYNAVSVLAKETLEYSVINVTDAQVSVSTKGSSVLKEKAFKTVSHDKLIEFVEYINQVVRNPKENTSQAAKKIQEAPFITFNGDLHNGGSPGTVLPEDVMYTYQKESEAIIDILMELEKPIYLVAGNHDGYVSMGHVPTVIAFSTKVKGKTLDTVVKEEEEKQGREGLYERYKAFTEATKKKVGGRNVNIFTGVFVRSTSQSMKDSYTFLSEEERNLPLYDGFYHWRKTYGPLYNSWSYGRNHYINLNSYECRQHRRSGWGMYTVNYGGCISQQQNLWVAKEVRTANQQGLDTVLIAHHDPRGGHKGKDFPFYFPQLEYTGPGLSFKNYVKDEIIMAKYCSVSSESNRTNSANLSCLHDGLQEWMLPDKEFDCAEQYKIKEGPEKGRCDQSRFVDYESEQKEKHHAWYSGYALIDKLARSKNVRTLLLGHTHYNSIENYLPGHELVPSAVILSKDDHKKFAEKTAAHENLPMRILSRAKNFFFPDDGEEQEVSAEALEKQAQLQKNGIQKEIQEHLEATKLVFSDAGHSFRRILEEHELLILRLTSVARLSTQTTKEDEKEMFGFSLFEVEEGASVGDYGIPQINSVTYLRNNKNESNKIDFKEVGTIAIDRTQPLSVTDLEGELVEGK